MPLRLGLGIEHIVHHEVETRGEIRHITAESLVGIDGYLQATEVDTIVGLKELLHIGVFIAFHPFRGEALLAEVLKSLITHSIHCLRRMVEDDLPSLLVEFNILLFATHYSSPISSLIQS